MQRRCKPRLLPRKISIQPSPGTFKHRRGYTICGTHRRQRLLKNGCQRSVEPKCSCPSNQSPVKPRPSAASRISPKGEANVVVTTSGSFQNSANIIPRIVQTTSIDPKVAQGSRRNAPQLRSALHSPPRRQARSAEAAAGTRARNSHAPPHQPSGLNQQRPHRRPLAAASPQAGAGLSFQNVLDHGNPLILLLRSCG